MMICISGLTASGKTTLAKLLSERYKLEFVSVSDLLCQTLGIQDMTRKDRLVRWLRTSVESAESKRRPWDDRSTDLLALRQVRGQSAGNIVIETQTLPWLAAPDNDFLNILLDAPQETRVRRLQQLLTNITVDEARTIVQAKDLETREALCAAWGIDVGSQGMYAWYDLVVTSSNERTKRQSAKSIAVTAKIAVAAVDVYRAYCQKRQSGEIQNLTQKFCNVARTHKARLLKITSLLLSYSQAPNPDHDWIYRRWAEVGCSS